MYVKADIEEKNANTLEVVEKNNEINKYQSKIFQKGMILALTITILVTILSQFK